MSRSTFLILFLLSFTTFAQSENIWRHGDSSVGGLKYPKDFSHFDYVNPRAPKGGNLRLSAMGTFDNLNPVPERGDLVAVLDLVARSGMVLETLMKASEDEIASEYGLLAEELSYPEDYSYVIYKLRENARWHDGMPVTPEDVIFSFDAYKANNPKQQNYYKHVVKAEKTGEREITFTFDTTGNQELPHIVGQLTILPQHWWTGTDQNGNPRDVTKTTLEPIMGSGPYKFGDIDPGSTFTLERVDNYWGQDLNVNVGQHNFDEVKFTYFLDRNVQFEAFKADKVDYWSENEAKRWASGYDFPAFNEGKIKREVLPNAYRSSGILVGFLPNMRLEKFSDARVRQAMNLIYDFEEQNRTLFFNSYNRINSYFYGSELASSGLPEGRELEILEELRGQIPDEVFTQEYQNPVGGTPQNVRANLQKAVKLFAEAGYKITDRKMINQETGEQFSMEILLGTPILEKVALSYSEALKRIGLDVSVRTVDTSQYLNRVRSRDYDVIYSGWAQSLRPGNEQAEYWGSAAADQEGSDNYMGISDPAIDALVEKIIFSKDRDDLIAATKALDRVLLANHFAIPTYTLRASRIAYWDRFEHPAELPTYSIGFPDVWWSKQAQ